MIRSQSGYTLIELMMAVAIIGILAAIAIISYQGYVKKTQMAAIYQTINTFRLPYQTLMNDGAGVADFTPSGLTLASQSVYCQLSVVAPNINSDTINAIRCDIQKISNLSGEHIRLDRDQDGNWSCQHSNNLPKTYLPTDCR